MMSSLLMSHGKGGHAHSMERLNKSASGVSLNGGGSQGESHDVKFERSKANVELRMKQDIDRLQKQLQKRKEKEKQAAEVLEMEREHRVMIA